MTCARPTIRWRVRTNACFLYSRVMYMTLAILAALSFTGGGVLMKHADGLRHTWPVVGFIALFSVGAAIQSQAMRGAELGTTYVLVLGLEAALAFGFGVAIFGETATAPKITAVMLIVAGIAILRIA